MNIKMYAVFENDWPFSEDAFHENLVVPTLAWKDNTGHGFVEWDKEKNRLSHFILFPTRNAAEEEMFEIEDIRPGDYLIKEIEISI